METEAEVTIENSGTFTRWPISSKYILRAKTEISESEMSIMLSTRLEAASYLS